MQLATTVMTALCLFSDGNFKQGMIGFDSAKIIYLDLKEPIWIIVLACVSRKTEAVHNKCCCHCF